MKIITGTVTRGRIELPLGTLADGAQVAVLAPDSRQPVRLTRAQQDELEATVQDLDEGRFVDGTDLLLEIKVRSGA